MKRRYCIAEWTACTLLLVFTIGCGHFAGRDTAAGSASRDRVEGVVLGKSPLNWQVTFLQSNIATIMPAASAVYTVPSRSVFGMLQPGDRIRADIVLPADGGARQLDDIAILSSPPSGDVLATLPPHPLLAGEAIPSIPMVNQDGKTVDLTDFRGKAVLITFVDTQCTDDCPIITRLFGRINQLLSRDPLAYARSQLITVSLDPSHDTPPVLRRYGLKYLRGQAAGFAHWQFVDLTPANLHRLAAGFGVTYARSHGDIVHSLDISLIGADNTLQQSWGGDAWDPAVIAKAVEKAALANKHL